MSSGNGSDRRTTAPDADGRALAQTKPAEDRPTTAKIAESDAEEDVEAHALLARLRNHFFDKVAPTRIGRYVVQRKLGSGGMGVVFAARDDELDRQVAIKVLRSGLTRGDVHRQRLEREAKSMARLSHPNVAHVYEVGHEGGQTFLVMELVDGVTLRQWCTERAWPDKLQAYLQAGEGLAAAHDAGLVHRDFKPDNALVGEDGRVRVLDFGLASADDDGVFESSASGSGERVSSSRSLTETGTVLGTPAYMSPEQHVGGTATPLSDQFAYCVALFEALYGRRPFAGKTVAELAAATQRGRLHKVGDRHGVPRRVHAAIIRGLRLDPGDRHPSMRALLAALRPSLVRRSWALGGLLVLGGAAAAAGILWTQPTTVPESPPDAPAQAIDPWASIIANSDLPAPVPTPLPGDPTATTVHRLRNGLTIYISRQPREPHVRAVIAARATAAEEGPGQEGASTLALNAVVEGTDRLGTLDFEQERPYLELQHTLMLELAETTGEAARDAVIARIEAAGRETSDVVVRAEISLATSDIGAGEFLLYTGSSTVAIDVPANRIGPWAALMSEAFQRPVFRGLAEHAAEQIELIRAQEHDALWSVTLQQRMAKGRGGFTDPRSRAANIRRLPYAAVRRFHENYYRPNNTAIVLVGDVRPEEAVPELERAFGDWEPAPVVRQAEAGQSSVLRDVQKVEGTGAPTVYLGWPPTDLDAVGGTTSPARYAFAGPDGLLAAMLGPEVGHGVELELQGGGIYVSAPVAKDSDHDGTQASLLAALKRVAEGNVPDAAWERALSTAELRGLAWAQSPKDLAKLVTASFEARQAWADVAATLAAAPTREQVQSFAAALVAHTPIAVHTRTGPPWSLDVEALRVPRQPLHTDRRSDFAKQIAEQPARALEPKFLVHGVDYTATLRGNGRVLTAETPSPLFHLGWVYPVGADHDPFVCDAVRAKVGLADFAGVDITAQCTGADTRVGVVASSARLEQLRPRLVEWLGRADLDAAAARAHVKKTLAARRSSRARSDRRSAALQTWALFGEAGLDAKLPTDAVLGRDGPTELPLALQRAVKYDPDILYAGPAPSELAADLPKPAGVPRPDAAPLALRTIAEPTLFVLHEEGLDAVQILVAAGASPAADDPRLLRAYALALQAAPAPPGSLTGALQDDGPVLPDYPQVLGLAVWTSASGLDAALETCSQIFTLDTTDAELAVAAERFKANFRANRVPASAIPTAVRSWRDGDVDPRMAQWAGMATITPDALRRYAARLANENLIVAFVADLDTIDLEALARHGRVVRVDVEEILRDPEASQSSFLGLD